MEISIITRRLVKSRGSMLMMPARNDCPSGWTKEYHGYLMTSYHGHKNKKISSVLTNTLSTFQGARKTRMVPYCTTMKGNVELSLTFPMLITES